MKLRAPILFLLILQLVDLPGLPIAFDGQAFAGQPIALGEAVEQTETFYSHHESVGSLLFDLEKLLPDADFKPIVVELRDHLKDPLPKMERKGLALTLHSEGRDFLLEPIDASRGIYSINHQRLVLDPKSSVFTQYQKIQNTLGTHQASTFQIDLFPQAHAVAWFIIAGVGLLLLALLAGVCSFVPKCPELRADFERRFASRPKNVNNDPMHSFTEAYALITRTYAELGCPSSNVKLKPVCERTKKESISLCENLKEMGFRNQFYFERTKDKKILNEKEFRSIACKEVETVESLSISEGYSKRKAQWSSKPSPISLPKGGGPESGVQ